MKFAAAARRAGKTVVTTNGCFDVLILNRYTPQIAKAKDLNIFFEIQAGHLAAKAGKMRSARKHLSRALSLRWSSGVMLEYVLTYLGRTVLMILFIFAWHMNRIMHVLKSRGKVKELEDARIIPKARVIEG